MRAASTAADAPGDTTAMATIYREDDGDVALLQGPTIAVVGYGNQGRPWALNLRDAGCTVEVCVRNDASRAKATADGVRPVDLERASAARVACLLVPDDAIPSLPLRRPDDGLTIGR